MEQARDPSPPRAGNCASAAASKEEEVCLPASRPWKSTGEHVLTVGLWQRFPVYLCVRVCVCVIV